MLICHRGIVERSSWDGGDYDIYEERLKEEEDRRRKRDELYKDRPERGSRGRREDFGDRRNNNRDSRPERSFRDGRDGRNNDRSGRDTSREASPVNNMDSNEADFFDSLMSELSDDLGEDKSSSRNERQSRGSRHHDNVGPSAKNTQSQNNAEDSFFANLMSELGGSIDEPRSSSGGGDSDLDDDDFFSNLEAELSQSLGDDFGDDDGKSESDDDDDDFFASLASEMGKTLEESPPKKSAPVDDDGDDDFFASLQNELEGALDESSSDDGVEDVLGEDFFSGLIDEIADEVEASQLDTPAPSKQKSASNEIDLAKLTVPVLKDMLRDKGLKVGGKKSELIERLQQS